MIGSVTHTPSWALWLSFSLGVLNVIVWAIVVVTARRAWKQLKPVVQPMLSALFGATQTSTTVNTTASLYDPSEATHSNKVQ